MESVARAGARSWSPIPRCAWPFVPAASKIVREEGVGALSIAAGAQPRAAEHAGVLPPLRFQGPIGVGGVPGHGTGRDARLRKRMDAAPDPVRAVVAWIDGRLDLAFNDRDQIRPAADVAGGAVADVRRTRARRAGLRRDPASACRTARRGMESGLFIDDRSRPRRPVDSWASVGDVERQWTTGDCDLDELRNRVSASACADSESSPNGSTP